MLGRNGRRCDSLPAIGRAVGGARCSRPNPSSVSIGGSLASPAAGDALAHRHDAPQHLDEQAGEREVRPIGVGRRVDQHDPAVPAFFRGHERRAVGEPRPGLGGQIDARAPPALGATPSHRSGSPARRTGCPARTALASPAAPRTSHRRSCARRGAAEPASDRHPARPDAGRQSAAADRRLDPFFDRRGLGRRSGPKSATDQHRELAFQQIRRAAAPDLGERLERAFEIIGLAQQWLSGGIRRPRRCRPGGGASARRPARTAPADCSPSISIRAARLRNSFGIGNCTSTEAVAGLDRRCLAREQRPSSPLART